MKQIKISAVVLSLCLSGVFSVNAYLPASETIALRKKLFTYEDNRKIFRPNSFTSKAIKSKRLKVRRQASNYAGRWSGTLYQGEGTNRQKFNFSMKLYRKGRYVSGISRITVVESPLYYGVMSLRGTIKKNQLSFREVEITKDYPEPETAWCVKSGKLRLSFKKGRAILKGRWQAPNCDPGTIVLKRISRK
jgi:hypothetical protein